ncbi:MAG: hypothetical protein ACOVSR_08940 [Bacteroidia bacterium]
MKESKYQRLFELMHKEHGLILLESEMQEIIDECRKIPNEEECSNCNEISERIVLKDMCSICMCE